MRGNAQGLTKRQLLPATTPTRSRALRRAMGEPERRLWIAVREAFGGMRWRRQVPFGLFHADFCCHAARLIVEVDGDEHALTSGRDERRTRFLEGEGYRVLRFSSAEVMTNIDGVLAAIAAQIRQGGRP